uniref:Response regulatory domain-containing protein n=1 Tax=Ananas comosus var. bracteatus TaxID=296719 RepID=A0A6V7NMJ2_ANACO|nr:unnamed protein product [Ananas comosus var. bracteatus]
MVSDSATGPASSIALAPDSSENFFNLFRILFVSDDMPFLEAVSRRLIASSYYVQIICLGGFAIEQLHTINAKFHIILLDAYLRNLQPWIFLYHTQRYFKIFVLLVIITANYTSVFDKRSIDQGASHPGMIAEVMSVLRIDTQSVASYMRLNYTPLFAKKSIDQEALLVI